MMELLRADGTVPILIHIRSPAGAQGTIATFLVLLLHVLFELGKGRQSDGTTRTHERSHVDAEKMFKESLSTAKFCVTQAANRILGVEMLVHHMLLQIKIRIMLLLAVNTLPV